MGQLSLFLPLIIIMGAFMFFSSRRQKKAMQATIDLHESLTVGDEIMTTAGLFGTLTGVSDARVDVEIAPGVVVSMLKLAVKEKVSDDLDDDEEDDEYEDDDLDEGTSAHELGQPSVGTEVRSDPNGFTKD